MSSNNLENNAVSGSSRDDLSMEMPEGLGFSMVMNQEAMKNYSDMSVSQKQQIIRQSKQVKSKREMDYLVNQIASNTFF